MKRTVDLRKGLFSRRVEFDFIEKMSELQKLREQVRLAELALMRKRIGAPPERPMDEQINVSD
jgi:hypothetical protein